MIHPSYVELMKVLNDDVVIGEEPVVNSRYSIVCAAAKRARQLIDGQEPLIADRNAYGRKPLSIAVDELSEGNLRILTQEEAKKEQEKLDALKEKTKESRALLEEKRAKEDIAKDVKEKRENVHSSSEDDDLEEAPFDDTEETDTSDMDPHFNSDSMNDSDDED